MSIQELPTVLIAYPSTFLCYDKFERKLSRILSNFNGFRLACLEDANNFIDKHMSSDARVSDSLETLTDGNHLEKVSHAIIFNDGESFGDLILNTNKNGIKSRIIDVGITKVVNKGKGDKFDVYIGRGSPWGNPYAVGFGASPGEEQNNREEAIRLFKYDFDNGYLKNMKERCIALKGKTLGCHCRPLPCHGDVIANYLNSLDDGT
jgi:hypothetical protein